MRVAAIGLLVCWAAMGQARYDLVLKGGHVIDPANQIDRVMDVAVAGGKIARVAENIPSGEAGKSVDVGGLYVTPGLVDLHAHVFGYEGAIFPDDSAMTACTTTIVDAGGSGWRSFDAFEKSIMKPSKTRVLAFLNIVGHGMIGPKFEDDTNDMDPEKTAAAMAAHPDRIVGIKLAHFGGPGWIAVDRAIAAGRLSGKPVMIDDKIFTNSGRTTREELMDKMRPGDIHTHMYNDRQVELVDRFTGKVQPYMFEARKRGVLFDLGHGAGSFLWPVATKAMEQGFAPDTISTDLHASSIMTVQSDMPNCISKMLILGMKLPDAIFRSTMNPAKVIHRFPEIGSLTVGQGADIAVLELKTGVFAYKDAWQKKMLGKQRLECALTVRAGETVFDRDGRGFPEWTKAGEYEVIR